MAPHFVFTGVASVVETASFAVWAGDAAQVFGASTARAARALHLCQAAVLSRSASAADRLAEAARWQMERAAEVAAAAIAAWWRRTGEARLPSPRRLRPFHDFDAYRSAAAAKAAAREAAAAASRASRSAAAAEAEAEPRGWEKMTRRRGRQAVRASEAAARAARDAEAACLAARQASEAASRAVDATRAAAAEADHETPPPTPSPAPPPPVQAFTPL